MVETEPEVVAAVAEPDAVVDPLVAAALPYSDKGLELTSELAPDAFDIVDDIEFAPAVEEAAVL